MGAEPQGAKLRNLYRTHDGSRHIRYNFHYLVLSYEATCHFLA